MNWNDYQVRAMQFRKPTADNVYAVLGLVEEAGEVAGKFAKWRRDNTSIDVLKNDVIKELGDVMWMIAAIASDMNVPLEAIATQNILKLESRLMRGTIGGSGDQR